MSVSPPLRVISMPAWSSTNGLHRILCEKLSESGCEVHEWTVRKTLAARRGDVIHLHWPFTALVRRAWPVAVIAVARIMLALTVARIRGAAIVYTAHNFENHDARFSRTEGLCMRWLIALLGAWIAPSLFARDGMVAKHPRLERVPHRVIPLGTYLNLYPNSISTGEARRRLSLPEHGRVLLFFGRVEPYKNVEGLLECFASVGSSSDRLIVAGACEANRAARLERLAASDRRVRLCLDFIKDPDVQVFFSAADVVVAPYTSIVNSATVLLALSFSRPIVAPRLGALPEVESMVGQDWVRLYEGPLVPRVLENALEQPPPTGDPDMGRMDWALIVSEVRATYGDAIRRSRAGVSAAVRGPLADRN